MRTELLSDLQVAKVPGESRDAVWRYGAGIVAKPIKSAVAKGADLRGYRQTCVGADGYEKAGLNCANRLMLGAMSGSALRLHRARRRLAICGGIQTIVLLLSNHLDEPSCTWAALSTDGSSQICFREHPERDGHPLRGRSGIRTSKMEPHLELH